VASNDEIRDNGTRGRSANALHDSIEWLYVRESNYHAKKEDARQDQRKN